MRVTRRCFLHAATATGGGLLIGAYSTPFAAAQQPQGPPPFEATAFVRITPGRERYPDFTQP
jgi:hypothetical protein